ncbi:hypothetical protein ASZ90_015983 [hydrocarbon metagenome]|uniref:Uncharacterized protein n=1 Tax=hydrocarbon metagenome TaxID=938273 RepID=A0A0W8F0F7_9ZZZZ
MHQLGAEICAGVHGEWFVQHKTKKLFVIQYIRFCMAQNSIFKPDLGRAPR